MARVWLSRPDLLSRLDALRAALGAHEAAEGCLACCECVPLHRAWAATLAASRNPDGLWVAR